MIQFPPNPATQVGGSHYTRLKIQPIALSVALGCDGLTLNVIKYLSRAPYKNGRQDYEKAIQYLEFLDFYGIKQRLDPKWHTYLVAYFSANDLPKWVYSALYDTFSGEYADARRYIYSNLPCV